MKKCFLIALMFSLMIGCAGSKQRLQLLSEEKYNSKSICITNPFVYLQVLDTKGRYFDEENQMQMINYIIEEARDSLERQFTVTEIKNPVDSQYFEFGNQLYDYMMKMEDDDNWTTVALPEMVAKEVYKSECDLSLLIFNSAFYRTKASMARGVAGSVALGILTLGSATVVPNKSISTMYVAIYSKAKRGVVYFDNEEDSDSPIEEKNAKNQIRTLLEDFLEAPKQLPPAQN